MSVPNVGITGVVQQAPPQSTLGSNFGDLAKFLLAVRAQQTAEAQQHAMQMYQEEQIAEAKRRQGAADELARLKAQQDAMYNQIMQRAVPMLAGPDVPNQTVQAAPAPMAGAPGLAAPITVGNDPYARFMHTIAPVADQALGNKGVQDALKAITDRRAEAAKGYDVSPGAVHVVNGKVVASNPKAPDLGSEYQAAKQTAGFGQIADKDLTPDQNRRIREEILARANAGAPKSTFNMGNSVAAAAAPKAMDIAKDAADKAADAVKDQETIKQLEGLMNAGTKTGLLANQRLALGNALVSLGWTNDPTVANTQAYKALVGVRVANIIKGFGSGTGLSDADREYAANIAGGKIDITEAALRRLFALAKRGNSAAIANGNKKAQLVPEEIRSAFLNTDPTDKSNAPATAPIKAAVADGKGNVQYGGKVYKLRWENGKWLYDVPGVGTLEYSKGGGE